MPGMGIFEDIAGRKQRMCGISKKADGPGASKLNLKWKGAGTFPEFPYPSMLTRQLLKRGEHSQLRGGRTLGA